MSQAFAETRIRLIILILAAIATTVTSSAGELVFPPPDNATNCQTNYASNTCSAVAAFTGGTFATDTTLGQTVYKGGWIFPYCISPTIGMTFNPPATEATVTIWNTQSDVPDPDNPPNNEQMKIVVTELIDGQPVSRTLPLERFPTYLPSAFSVSGTNITHVSFTVTNEVGYPDYDFAGWEVISAQATQPIYPTVDLSIIRNSSDYSAKITYAFPSQSDPAARYLTLQVLPAGQDPGSTILTQTNLPLSGTLIQPLPSFDTDRTLRATASACDGVTTADASISCTHCKGPATSVGGPVRLFDGVMTYTEVDPLPSTIGPEFRREYSSGTQVDGAFGQGWVSIFDANALPTQPDNKSVSVVSEDRTRATFRLLTTGVWAQTWPVGGTASILTGSETAGYAFRDAAGTIVRTFGTNHKLTRLQNLRTGRAVSLTYDVNGNPTRIFDEAGNWSCTITTTNGHIATIAVDGRPDLTWTYAYAGALLSSVTVTGAPGAWRSYEYVNGKMTAVRDANGTAFERHDYDASGRAISSYDPSGDLTNILYASTDANGVAATSVTRADNSQAQYQQTFSKGAVVTQRADGGCSSCGSGDATAAYDTHGNLWRLQNGRGYITESLYDETGRQLLTTTTALAPSGCNPDTDAGYCRLTADALAATTLAQTPASQTTSFTYADANWPGKPTRVERNSVLQPGGVSVELFSYDAATGEPLVHSVTGFVDTSGTQETHTTTTARYGSAEGAAFNPGGAFQSAWLSLPQPARERKSIDGPRTDVSDVTAFVYYPADPTVPGPWRRRVAAARDALGHITRYEDYDVFGHALTVTDANGAIRRTTYDALGRLLTSTISAVPGCNTTLDPLCATDLTTTRTYAPGGGELVSEQRPAGNVTSYVYDTRGRLQTLTHGTASTPLEKIDYTYDPTTGKKATETYSAWQNNAWVVTKSESITYTSDGQVNAVVHPDNTAVRYAYLPDGTLRSVQDENHNAPNTTYTYDAANRVKSVTQILTGAPGGQIVTSYGYDVQGNLTSVTDPNGNVTTYVYDDFGRLLRQASPVAGVTTYTCDAAGNVLTTTDANGATTARSYDALGRVLSSVSTRGAASEAINWTYDDATAGNFGIGRVATLSDPTGSTSYQYERRGMPRSEAKTIAGNSYTTSYTYDANGNRSRMTYPSGLIAQYTSDFADRPYSLTAGATSIVTSATYLPSGPITSLAFGNGTTRTMRYDTRYRPLENKVTGPSGVLADYNYAEDNAGNITQIHDATNAAYDRDFAYDDLNRLTTANSGSSLWGAGSYTYDAMGNMTASSLGTWKATSSTFAGTTPKLSSVVENGTPRAVTYDAVGNETAVGTSSFGYSPRNSLVSADTSAYVYDGRGLMTIATYSVLSANVTPSIATGGVTASGSVTLNVPAAADTLVRLTSSNSAAASVPASVTVTAGQTSTTFTVATSPVAASTTATITAAFNQYSTSALITIVPAQLTSLAVSPSTVNGGSGATGTVTLDGVAATSLVISLSSNNGAAAVPPTVTVPAGSSSANFAITTTAGVFGVTATITATAGSVSRQATLTLASADLASVTINPSSVINGGAATGTVALSGPASSPMTVSLSSSSADAYANGSQITIQQGATSGTFQVATNLQSTTARTVTITATHGSVTRQGTITVNPPSLSSFVATPVSLTAADRPVNATGTATINGPAPAASYTTTFTSSNTALVATPAPVTIANGATSGQTTILTNPVASQTSVTVTATDPTGVQRSQAITLQPATVTLASLTLGASSVIGSNKVTGTVTLTAAAPSPGIDVDLGSTDRAKANPGVFVHVAAGATSATFTIQTVLVSANTPVTISAVHAATTKTAALTLQAPTASFYVYFLSANDGYPTTALTGGTTGTGSVLFNKVFSSGSAATATLTSSNPAVVSVPSSVQLKTKGAQSVNFTITTGSVTSATLATITATSGGTTFTENIVVVPVNGVALRSIFFPSPATIANGAGISASLYLTGPAPAGGVNVTITGSRTNVARAWGYNQALQQSETTVYIPAGSSSGQLNVSSLPFTGIARGVHVTGSLGAVTFSDDVLINPATQAQMLRHDDVPQCASLSVAPCLLPTPRAVDNVGDATGFYLYTPETQLLAETAVTSAPSKPIAYCYLWFGGMPVASVESATNTTRWYADDHLGTPFLQTGPTGAVAWRAEHTPYGDIYATRNGAGIHQPLRLPGQVAQDGSNLYNNVFRWYRSGWGAYTQVDPLFKYAVKQPYAYADENPIRRSDPSGLKAIATPNFPSRHTATTVCQDDRVVPFIGAEYFQYPGDEKCLGECVQNHEISHANDMERSDSTVCKDKRNGVVVAFDNEQEQYASERRADLLEIRCLQHKEARCPQCKTRIDFIVNWLTDLLINGNITAR